MNVELYLGDCLDFMRTLADKSIDCVLTDPPYGINYPMLAGGRNPKNGWKNYGGNKEWDAERPTKEYFEEILRVGKTVIIWGGNYFTDYLPPTMRWLIWDKGQRNFSLADFEMAWTSQNNASRIFNYSRSQALLDGKVHPTQKPIALMRWCLHVCGVPPGCTVFDPFVGSGTTGIACMQTGRDFVGCEKDPSYFATAKRRIELAQAQPLLFVDEPPQPGDEPRQASIDDAVATAAD